MSFFGLHARSFGVSMAEQTFDGFQNHPGSKRLYGFGGNLSGRAGRGAAWLVRAGFQKGLQVLH